ncbi:class I SAM-dependent methyltransferase [Tsuneonella mangrovi]|uniref:class I SAM-dependent methyltransferase n=1 Tax=Tsuneonella mangrovi TaxID=1982042 RepID=UPI000BA1CEDB|nr:class I SAM-dependent methyltransferase [Tsuneonella mangrovi]
MRNQLAIALVAALCGCASLPPVQTDHLALTTDEYQTLIDAAHRPAADVARDVDRKPAELMQFAEILPGEKVGDEMMGGGYLTRVEAAVVGPKGHVYAYQPDEFIAFRAAYADDQKAIAAALANVTAVNGPLLAQPYPVPLDTIITVQNFHDLYLKDRPPGTPEKVAANMFAALKPGGTLVVVDHRANPGDTNSPNEFHRIEKDRVIKVVEAAGFKLDAESDMYANPQDPHDISVFNKAIRGHTDQFALRFRKPG